MSSDPNHPSCPVLITQLSILALSTLIMPAFIQFCFFSFFSNIYESYLSFKATLKFFSRRREVFPDFQSRSVLSVFITCEIFLLMKFIPYNFGLSFVCVVI